jgi:Zn-dependent protease/predicted transcriptional regulator
VFGKGIQLFRIFGVPIRADASWLALIVLMSWTLATGAFPRLHPGLSPLAYWWMGILGTCGLFVSVIIHEMSHALVARRFGIAIRGITLFLFGGVAEMASEPPSPRAELLVAGAGPAASFGLALLGLVATTLGGLAGLPAPVQAVLAYLAVINAVLAVFNLIPAFPLDGGRILRAALWHWKGSLRQATRTTSRLGTGFGTLFIAVGVYQVIEGDFIGGMWWFLIGLFLRNASQMSYQQLLLRQALEGEPVSRFMRRDPVTVPRSASVHQLVDDYVYRYHFKMFPVLDDAGKLLGRVTTQQIKELPRDEWDSQTVGAVAERCGPGNTVTADTDALRALSLMSRSHISRLMVVDGDRLVGILALKDLLQFFAFKMELEEAA